MNTTLVRRLGVLAVTSALTAGVLGAVPAQADPTPSATAASTWLSGQLTDGLLVNDQFEFTDYGLSIDAAFAAVAAGDNQTATRIRDAVAAQIDSYISGGESDPGSTYAGATAKALVLAQRTGSDPRDFGGVDLVARLEAVTLPSGRIQDTSGFGDFANTIGQSFAAQGLRDAGSPEAAAATGFLLAQQCSAGFFRLDLGDGAACTPETDATSFAITALAGRQSDPAVAAAITRAVAWLAATESNGAYGGGGPTAAVNTNSSGLSAAALGSVCQVAPAGRAAAYVRGFQVPTGETGPLSGDVGAIAYDAAAIAAGRREGIVTETRDQFRRATAQAATGLIWDASAAPTVSLTGPTSKVDPASAQSLTLTGAAAGEVVCLTTPTGTQRLVGTGSPLTVPVTAPASGSASYSATTGPGAAAVTLSATRTRAALSTKRVQVGDKVKIRLTNLAPGTTVKIKLRGVTVKSRTLGASSDKTLSFRAKGKAGKPGTATVKIVTRNRAQVPAKQVKKLTLRILR